MARCAGNGWDFCEDCVNSEADQSVCESCDDGDQYEPFDDIDQLSSVHQLKFIRFKEAA